MIARKARKNRRGAAIIEAVIVISTMVVFMGLIVFTRKAYGMKLDLQQQTRANVLYYASHGCTGAGGKSIAGTGTIDGSPEAEAAANKSTLPDKGAASSSWNEASATATDTAVWHTAWDVNAEKGGSIDLQRQELNRKVHAASDVMCNEKHYDSQWTAWMKFGVDFVSSGFGGAGSLFK